MKTIGILIHENEQIKAMPIYAVHFLAQIWRRVGVNVVYLKGLSLKQYPAVQINFIKKLFEKRHSIDLLIIHVDLSVVPDAYPEFATRFPIVLNKKCTDIRKSTISKILVKPDDDFNGKVIAKTNLNSGGTPETRLLGYRKPVHTGRNLSKLPGAYRIYDNPGMVPENYFKSPDWVVERFLPEFEDGLYHTRYFSFLGKRWNCGRRSSPYPIIKGSNPEEKREVIEPHPDIFKLREELGIDYGKLDYVIHEGKVVLLDANKTISSGRMAMQQDATRLQKFRENLAEGIWDYF